MPLLPSGSAKYKGALLLCAAGLIAFALSTVYGKHGLVHLQQMRADYQQIARSVTQMQHDNARMQVRIQHLESDPHYIEKLARERLGLAKPGEIVYRFDTPPKSPAESSRPSR